MSQPGFTCDHCGAPVGLHDDRCSRCGRSFDAVRCPRCGHQGPSKAFDAGCPSCRYGAPSVPPLRPRPSRPLFAPVMVVLLGLLATAIVVSWFLRGR